MWKNVLVYKKSIDWQIYEGKNFENFPRITEERLQSKIFGKRKYILITPRIKLTINKRKQYL